MTATREQRARRTVFMVEVEVCGGNGSRGKSKRERRTIPFFLFFLPRDVW